MIDLKLPVPEAAHNVSGTYFLLFYGSAFNLNSYQPSDYELNMIALKSGKPYPLGATITDGGVNFAVFSENAERINLEIFRSIYDSEPAEVIELKEKTAHVWHVLVPGLKSGALYGYRAFGPYDPNSGMRFNSNKLLIDPYAK